MSTFAENTDVINKAKDFAGDTVTEKIVCAALLAVCLWASPANSPVAAWWWLFQILVAVSFCCEIDAAATP